MNQGIYTLAATMINQLNRVDTISNNLANANTVGFKQDNVIEGSFNYYLNKNHENITNKINRLNNIENTIPKIDGHYIDEEHGPIVTTSNKLDFAINQRDIFFKVKVNGEVELTKNGSFKNLNGFLVTKDGNYVLSQDNQRISIEEGFENQISLVKTTYNNIDKHGNNNYKIQNRNEVKDILDNDAYLIQGSIEKSNINTISSMVGLIDSQRRLEQAQKASTGIDEMNQKLIDKLTR